MKQRLKVKIYGKVQGVLFRFSAAEKAKELGLVGFVHNELDGTVYIEAEGDHTTLQEFLKWCKKGPALASVTNIQSEFTDTVKGYLDFEY